MIPIRLPSVEYGGAGRFAYTHTAPRYHQTPQRGLALPE